MKRTCDACGKEKEINDGKTCERGHFICSSCKWVSGFISRDIRKKCPVCDKPLR